MNLRFDIYLVSLPVLEILLHLLRIVLFLAWKILMLEAAVDLHTHLVLLLEDTENFVGYFGMELVDILVVVEG